MVVMTDILIISPTRAEAGPLASVIAALPEAEVVCEYIAALTDMYEPWESHRYCLMDYTQAFREHKPKLVLLLGDRYETHAAALAAHFLRIPIAHIHGGETTTGAFDDALRHGITHMAKLHFVAHQQAYMRVVEMRKDPQTYSVHIVGAPGLDTIAQGSAKRDKKLIVVSYYPETNLPDGGHRQLRRMIKHLDQFTPDHAIFFSRVNSDPGHELITNEIEEFIDTFPTSASWITPNTREQYLHLCEHAAVAVGNSSSLVIECPWMGLPSVLVGDRQTGRPLAPSVWSADESGTIERAIHAAMKYPQTHAPIYRGGAAPKIAKICREFVACAA